MADESTEDTGSDTGVESDAALDTENVAEKGGDDGKSDKSNDEGTPQDEGTPKDGDDNNNNNNSSKEAKPEDKGAELEGAPEAYADFVLPEGAKIDATSLQGFQEFARESNLSQEQAQRGVDLYTKTVGDFAEQQQEKWDEIKEGWVREAKADKSLHDGEGRPDAAIALARGAIDKIGGKQLKEAMDLTGMGNHPAVVKAFHKIGKAMAEDKFVFGGGSEDNRSAADKLYPSMAKNN